MIIKETLRNEEKLNEKAEINIDLCRLVETQLPGKFWKRDA